MFGQFHWCIVVQEASVCNKTDMCTQCYCKQVVWHSHTYVDITRTIYPASCWSTHCGLFPHSLSISVITYNYFYSTHYSGDTLYTHCSHAFSLKGVGKVRTECGSEVKSFSCNWGNLSTVKLPSHVAVCICMRIGPLSPWEETQHPTLWRWSLFAKGVALCATLYLRLLIHV